MNKTRKYKGYTISQASNNHIMITKDNKMVFHAQCNKKLNTKELKQHIEWYIKMYDNKAGTTLRILNKGCIKSIQIVRSQANKIDDTVYNFLENNGYKNVRKMTIDELQELYVELVNEDKQLRVEIFDKEISNDMNSLKYESVIIPFFDSYNQPLIGRLEIYKMLDLESKGYRL